jgi:hypothetical protein
LNLKQTRQIRYGVRRGIRLARAPFALGVRLAMLDLCGTLYAPLVTRAMRHAFATTTNPPRPRKARS